MGLKMKSKLIIWNLFLLTIIVVFISLDCSTQLSQRSSIIEHAFEYKNIDNTIAVVYTDDVRFELGTISLEGKQAMRVAAGWDSVMNSHFSYSNFRMFGDTVICKCTEENDLDKLVGIEHGYFNPVTFVFNQDRVKYVKFQRTPESRRAYNAAWEPFTKWASKERAQDLALLMPAGKLVVSAQTAVGWLALVKEWRNTTKLK
jgi:hypothetical protein